MSATLFDVSRRCGVSTATVSRVINGSPLVHERTRRRVLDTIRDLGYRPSHAARMLALQRTDTIGVIFPQIDSGFFSEVLRGIDDVAAHNKFHLMAAFSHGVADEQELVSRFIHERRADALILLNLLLPNGFIRRIARDGLPIVLIDRPVAGANLFAVSMDNVGGAEAALKHLYEQGFSQVAVIAGPAGSYDAEQRLIGCRQAAAGRGLPLAREWIWPGNFTEESGRAAVENWLARGRPLPDAIFATNDAMAFGVHAFLRENGYQVPDDVALVGFDDMPLARHLGLTTVQVPMHEMGKAAAEAAVHQVRHGKAIKNRVLPVELVVRQTSIRRSV
jgi:LacI family transcriptional regulator